MVIITYGLLPSFEFTLEAILVVESGKNPRTSALLYATPNLFQRIYYNEYSRMSTLASNTDVDKKNVVISPGSWLLKTAYAERGYTPRTPVKVDLSHLIAKGRDIFVNETFEGNGRTCATCHRPDNNHTIDPKYIAQLPITDPLFVAETNPLLSDLEKPTLLRQFGLFVSHVDGFNRPGVMRSVPSLLALSTSLTVETRPMGGEFFEDTDFLDKNNQEAHAVGWSQDGAVGHGSLREFAKGAVQEHFPKSLGRAEGIDFRMPTEDELDALEAYMLSLGRTDDPSLSELKFRSPWIEKGKELFNQKQNPVDKNGNPLFGRSANCSGCHMNAGASSSTTLANPTRDTGVERMRDTLARLSDADIPYDGGFGQVLQEDCGPDYNAHCYSDGSNDPRGIRPFSHQRLNRFNTPSLIEAADTAPFFHNHSIATLEEAVGYYNTNAFNESPGAFTSSGKNRQTHIDSSQVEAVALFLRYINVLENIRSANQLAENAFTADSLQAKELVRLAIADTEDAIQVIEEGGFIPHPEVLAVLKKALESDTLALSSRFSWQRTSDLKKSIQLCNQAKSEIIDQ